MTDSSHASTLAPPDQPKTAPCQAASLGELAQALAVGFPRELIVFDSPAKTRAELAFALQQGVAVNLDNFQELARAAELMARHPEWAAREGGQLVGLRVNPQVGAGSIAALSTGGAVSKFGFPLGECRAELVAAFVKYPWLNMLHLHVGSQVGRQGWLVGRGFSGRVHSLRGLWVVVR
jgi:diaminopimelate decarboxylase